MTDPSSALSVENIIGTAIAGLGIAVIAIRKYLQERKAPTSQTGDRIVPGISIADTTPLRDIASAQVRTAVAAERIATGIEGMLALMKQRREAEAAAQEDDFRDRLREIERMLADRPRALPRRRT